MKTRFATAALLLATLLSNASAEPDPVADIRKRFAEVNAAELEWRELKPPFEDEYGGTFKRGSLAGKVLKTVLGFDMGDHGGNVAETYYDSTGNPIFLFTTSSHWSFTGKEEGETIDKVTERRIYLNDGKIIRALEKKYEFSDEKDKAAAAAHAKNTPLDCTQQTAARLLTPLRELPTAKALKIVVLADQLSRAEHRLTEPAIPDDADRWDPIETPADEPLTQVITLPPANAAFNFLLALDVIQEGENAELPDHIDTDILTQTDSSATVVITLDGLRDDDLQAERYRLHLTKKTETWELTSIGQQVKKWPDRTSGEPSTWYKPRKK